MIYFISDLHLSAETPKTNQIFGEFLNSLTPKDTLYILGDFFELWAGDDCLDQSADSFLAKIINCLQQKTLSGTSIFLMHGNRDFLLSSGFSKKTGITLIPDPYVLSLQGNTFILSHGDFLCTADTEYQKFRQMTRNETWQQVFLQKPLAERLMIAKMIREQSEKSRQGEPASQTTYQMDLEPSSLKNFLQKNPCATFIHGHTHLPDEHTHNIDGREVKRWVLSDWHEDKGECLTWDGLSIKRHNLF